MMTIVIEKKYLAVPVNNHASSKKLCLYEKNGDERRLVMALDCKIDLLPLGSGDLPIPELVANIPDRVKHIIVELDYCNVEMLEALKRSYEYMTSNGLAVGNK